MCEDSDVSLPVREGYLKVLSDGYLTALKALNARPYGRIPLLAEATPLPTSSSPETLGVTGVL